MRRATPYSEEAHEETTVKDGQQVQTLVTTLEDILGKAWNAQTSVDPGNWDSTNPAWGQCAVTALLVQELFGGELLRATIDGVSHYWNVLPGGKEIDLTRHQFGPSPRLENDPDFRERAYVLSFSETKERYALLRAKVLRDSRLRSIKRLIRGGIKTNANQE